MSLTQRALKELLIHRDDGVFVNRVSTPRGRKAGQTTGNVKQSGYVQIQIFVDGKQVRFKAHRLAWLYHYGEWPPGHIDHINRVRSDNRIENLRLATHAENLFNCSLRADNKSGHKNVHAFGKGFRASVQANKKKHQTKVYDTVEEAIVAATLLRIRLHGNFVCHGGEEK